jgi:peptide deformylase
MVRDIYLYGHDVLRKIAEDADINNRTLPFLIADMFETMRNANGSGLAAPQIGLSKRIIVLELKEEKFQMAMINPKILEYSSFEKNIMGEGCLSFPGIELDVKRSASIEVEWYDENKKYHKEHFDGIVARIIQHEIDHLNGTFFIDRISPEEKLNIFMKLEDIKNRKVNVNYPTR